MTGPATFEPQPLDAVLAIEPAGEDVFRAQLPGFGGVTLGCATRAAARTTALALHSLHVYFFRPVPTAQPALLRVERMRDGRRFAHRRVRVCDAEDRVCCELLASFAAPGQGVELEEPAQGPKPPDPETLPSEAEIARSEGWTPGKPGPIGNALEWRFVGGTPWSVGAPSPTSSYQGWLRPRAPLPDTPELRAAALAFLSDMHSHMTVARRLGGHFDPTTGAYTSLDQVLWVHRDEPWTDWRLITSVCDVASSGRAFSRRSLHARDGRLIASMAQEQWLAFPAGG